MTLTYTDEEIVALVEERKRFPQNWDTKVLRHNKLGRREGSIECTGDKGNKFRLIFRHSNSNLLDFSVILAVQVPMSNHWFRLRRCNGKSHEHTNHIEGITFYDFHIHQATEKYQEIGSREDAYAVAIDKYDDFDGAVDYMIQESNFDAPPKEQLRLSL